MFSCVYICYKAIVGSNHESVRQDVRNRALREARELMGVDVFVSGFNEAFHTDKEKISKLDEDIKIHENWNRCFVDIKFGPKIKKPNEPESKSPDDWLRIKDLYQFRTNQQSKPVLVRGKFKPDDIAQGTLDDCYFLSSLSVIAQRPSNIGNLILNRSMNKPGLCTMRFCKNGKWTEVNVDDRFPTFWGPQNGKSVQKKGAHGHYSQFWVHLLEKCWAKLIGEHLVKVYKI